jgi:dihydrofolate synthase/folylpolyglutamate synthase
LGIGLLGAHQVANASLAAAGAVALTKVGLHVGDAALRRGLAMARVPGRLEVYPGAPTVILDGAHNPDKMAALAVALDQIWPDRPVVGVLGFKRGHDLAATLAPLAPRLGGAILTSFDATTDFGRGQAVAIESIVSVLQTLGFPGWVQRTVDPIEALQQALARAAADGLVVVTGSLYLVGGVRPWLRRYQAQNDAAV